MTDQPRGFIAHVQNAAKAPTVKTASTNPQCPGCNPPLLFSSATPVMGGLSGIPGYVTLTPFYWAPPTYTYVTATYKTIVNGYLQNVASASGSNTNVYSVATQYYQDNLPAGAAQKHIAYVISAGAELDDTTAFPASCVPATGYTACVTDKALQSELKAYLNAHALPIDDSHAYIVLFPSGVESCATNAAGKVVCSNTDFCAYHNAIGPPYLVYTSQPFPNLTNCAESTNGGPQAPNGDPYADTQVSAISHEASESITDWAGAWADSAGYENGDECNFVFGSPKGGVAGAYYNQVVGTGHYYTQDEFSNEDYTLHQGDANSAGTLVWGCVQQEELPVASFTAPSTPDAGTTVAFDGRASSDPDNTGALIYRWTWGDGTPNGSGATPSHIFCSPGTYNVTLTVTDVDGWSASVSNPVTAVKHLPTVTAVAPLSGPASGGTRVTISGCALTGATAVYFGATSAASFSPVSDTQMTAVSPAHDGGMVDVTVVTPTGTSTVASTDRFTYAYFTAYGAGILASGPDAGASSSTSVDVFMVGTDNALWKTTWNGTKFSGQYQNLGGYVTADPGVVDTSASRIDVFVRGSDSQLYQKHWDGTAWSGWSVLGGILSTGPDATLLQGSPSRMDVWVSGSDAGLYYKTSLDGGNTFGAWQALGGILTSDPRGVSSAPGQIDVFVRGSDYQLYQRTWTASGGWANWVALGGILNSAPDAASCAVGHLDVFVLGTDNAVWQRGWNGSSWTAWTRLAATGGPWTSSPSAVCRPGTNIIDIFVRGTDNAVWTFSVPGT